MEHNLCPGELLAAAGLPEEAIRQTLSGQDGAVRPEYRRFLCRYRCRQREALKEQRRQLACLDYLIAQVFGDDAAQSRPKPCRKESL